MNLSVGPLASRPDVAFATPVPAGAPTATDPAGPSFESLLRGALGETNAAQQSAEQLVSRSLLGDDVTQVEVFSAVKKADLALRLLVQVRNKLLEAYREIQQMQV